MSHKSSSRRSALPRSQAQVFAALGDDTRLSLVAKLGSGQEHSISQLSTGFKLTRQAVTKHLHVLETAGIVHSKRRGRENVFKFNPQPVDEARQYLEFMSAQWDQALARLKSFVED